MLRLQVNPLRTACSLVVLLLFLAACGGDRTYVDFGRTQSPSETSDFAAPSKRGVLRFGIAPLRSPAYEVKGSEAFADYLERQLGRPVVLVRRRTYAEVNDLVRNGEIEAAFVGSGAFVEGRREFGMELLAAGVRSGRPFYSSYVVVPTDSPVTSLSDLRGKTFAFTDPLSNSGRLVPLAELIAVGESPDEFFGTSVFTQGHDNSIRAVADDLVDGAAVDSWVYDELTATEADIAARTRVVAVWGPYGSPPVVVNPELDQQLKARLQSVLVGMDADPEARAVLELMGVDGFSIVDTELYAGIERLSNAVAGRREAG